MDLLHSIKKQRELFSKTLSMPKDFAFDSADNDSVSATETETEDSVELSSTEMYLNSIAKGSKRPASPRSKRESVNDARQLVSSLRTKREDLIRRFDKGSATTPKSLNVIQTSIEGTNSRPKQKAVVDLSLLEEKTRLTERKDCRLEVTELSVRVKSFQDKIRSMDESAPAAGGATVTTPTLKTASVSESLAKFESKCNVPYEARRKSTPAALSRVKQSGEKDSAQFGATGLKSYAQNNSLSSSAVSYPPRTACNEHSQTGPPVTAPSHALKTANVSESLAKFESKCNLPYDFRRKSTPAALSRTKQSDENNSLQLSTTSIPGCAQNNSFSSSVVIHPSRTACAEQSQAAPCTTPTSLPFKKPSVSESLAKFESRCNLPHEVRRKSTPVVSKVKQSDERDSSRFSATGIQNYAQTDRLSSSVVDYPSRPALNESHPTPSTPVRAPASLPWGKRDTKYEDDHSASKHRRPTVKSTASQEEYLKKALDASWIKRCAMANEQDETLKNKTMDSSWIKRAREELCLDEGASAEMDVNTGQGTVDRNMPPVIPLHDQDKAAIGSASPNQSQMPLKGVADRRNIDSIFRRQSTLSASASPSVNGRQKFASEPSWITKQDSRGVKAIASPLSARRKFVFTARERGQDQKVTAGPAASWIKGEMVASSEDNTSMREADASPAASWLKNSTKASCEDGTPMQDTEDDTQHPLKCPARSPSTTAPSPIKSKLSSPHHSRGNSAGNILSLGGMAGLAARERRKSGGDLAWMVSTNTRTPTTSPRKVNNGASRAPWVKSEGRTGEPAKPNIRISTEYTTNLGQSNDEGTPFRVKGCTPRHQWQSTQQESSSQKEAMHFESADKDAAHALEAHNTQRPPWRSTTPVSNSHKHAMHLDSTDSGAARRSAGPHNMALRAKVSMFESPKAINNTPRNIKQTFSPTASVAIGRQSWNAPDQTQMAACQAVTAPQNPLNVQLPNSASPRQAQLPQTPSLTKVKFIVKTSLPKNTKIYSLITKMEKFSQGGEFEGSCPESDRSECGHDAIEELESDSESENGSEQVEILTPSSRGGVTPASSVEHSIILEYGDAGFSFREDEEVDEAADHEECYLFEESEVASGGSTYKIDNYQKDFNETIPIQTPWEGTPMTSFDAFAEFVNSDKKNAMTIVSIAPTTTLRAPSYDDVIEYSADYDDYEQSNNEYALREETLPMDRSLATRRTYHQVARSSLLSAGRTPRRSMSVDCISLMDDEPDPIFQVADEYEKGHGGRKSLIKKKFLSTAKAKDDEGGSSQEENKPTKRVFQMLKKGLGTASSKKDEPEHHMMVEDVGDESVIYDDDYYVRAGDCGRTTISSITRSVNSNPGDSSHRSADSKPTMPLAVLNGFFKAARKLQKKRKGKSKSRRGRSMSNKPPPERRMLHIVEDHDPAISTPTSHMSPPTELQLWPNLQQVPEPEPAPVPAPEPEPAPVPVAPNATAAPVIGDRRFGTYGGLLYASSRSKALAEPAPQIQSLASW